jgi:TetR/AcrR family transcriptional regulator, fatty acid metabolism regulator protein
MTERRGCDLRDTMSELPSRRQIYRLPRERRIADIMEAARTVFETKGYEDALISEIAERAAVVEGTIYRYFDNKHDLLIKVVAHWYEEMLSDYDERLKGIRGTWNRLRFMVWQHLTCIHQHPRLCRLMFQEIRANAAYGATAVFELNRQYTRRTLDIVKDAIKAGEFREDTPLRLVRDMIYGCVEHHTWAYLRGEGDFRVDETADMITNIIYRGVAVEATPKARVGAPSDGGMEVAVRLERAVERLEVLSGEFANRR